MPIHHLHTAPQRGDRPLAFEHRRRQPQRPHPAEIDEEPERRQSQRRIVKHLHQLPARAKQQHRPKLRIHAAAEDQLVAIQPHHGLHGHAHEILRTGFLADAGLDGAKRGPDRFFIRQVQFYATHIALVGDRLGEHFQDNRITDFRSAFQGFIFVPSDSSLHCRNAVK